MSAFGRQHQGVQHWRPPALLWWLKNPDNAGQSSIDRILACSPKTFAEKEIIYKSVTRELIPQLHYFIPFPRARQKRSLSTVGCGPMRTPQKKTTPKFVNITHIGGRARQLVILMSTYLEFKMLTL